MMCNKSLCAFKKSLSTSHSTSEYIRVLWKLQASCNSLKRWSKCSLSVRKKPRKKLLRSAEKQTSWICAPSTYGQASQAGCSREDQVRLNDRIKEQTAQMKVLNARLKPYEHISEEAAAAMPQCNEERKKKKRSATSCN